MVKNSGEPIVLTPAEHIEQIMREWEEENAPKQPAHVVAGWALNGLFWSALVILAVEVLRP